MPRWRGSSKPRPAEIGEAGAALARHWRDAGDSQRAFEYFLSAAGEAEQGWAKEHAVTLYREALALVPDDAERRGRVVRRLAVAEQAVYHVPDARLLGLGREDLAGEVGRRDVAGDLGQLVDGVLAERGRVREHRLFVRCLVDAEGAHLAGVVDDDVAVLPCDLGKLLLGEQPGAHRPSASVLDLKLHDQVLGIWILADLESFSTIRRDHLGYLVG